MHITHSVVDPYLTGTFSQPAAGEEGNTGRNAFFGPGQATGDVSLFKTLHLTDRIGTELRAEIFNVTNTPQFTNPDSNVSDASSSNGIYSTGLNNLGRVTGTRSTSERQMQMALCITF